MLLEGVNSQGVSKQAPKQASKGVIKLPEHIAKNEDKKLNLALMGLALASMAGVGLYALGSVLEKHKENKKTQIQKSVMEQKAYVTTQYAKQKADKVLDELIYENPEFVENEGKKTYEKVIAKIEVNKDEDEIKIEQKSPIGSDENKTEIIVFDNLGNLKEFQQGHKEYYATNGERADERILYDSEGNVIALEKDYKKYLDKKNLKIVDTRQRAYYFQNGQIKAIFNGVSAKGDKLSAKEAKFLS